MKTKEITIDNSSREVALAFDQSMPKSTRAAIEQLVKKNFPGFEVVSFVRQEDGTYYCREVETAPECRECYANLLRAVLEDDIEPISKDEIDAICTL